MMYIVITAGFLLLAALLAWWSPLFRERFGLWVQYGDPGHCIRYRVIYRAEQWWAHVSAGTKNYMRPFSAREEGVQWARETAADAMNAALESEHFQRLNMHHE